MGSRDLTYILFAVIVFLVARAVYYCMDPRIRKRFGLEWGEPAMTPSREMTGLALIVIVVLLALLFQKACPFPRIE